MSRHRCSMTATMNANVICVFEDVLIHLTDLIQTEPGCLVCFTSSNVRGFLHVFNMSNISKVAHAESARPAEIQACLQHLS